LFTDLKNTPTFTQLYQLKYAVYLAFHNNYEQISNTLISNHDPLISKKNGGKNGKKFPKENNAKRRNPVLPARIIDKK